MGNLEGWGAVLSLLLNLMINIKVSLPGFNKDLSISQFIGNTDNTLDGCKFWINEQIDSPDIWFVFENVIPNEH